MVMSSVIGLMSLVEKCYEDAGGSSGADVEVIAEFFLCWLLVLALTRRSPWLLGLFLTIMEENGVWSSIRCLRSSMLGGRWH